MDQEEEGYVRESKRQKSVKKNNAQDDTFMNIDLLARITRFPENCLKWLKAHDAIPKEISCPNCSSKMSFEPHESAEYSFEWICKECGDDTPRYSPLHGTWLEDRGLPLRKLLLLVYTWTKWFSQQELLMHENMLSYEEYKIWNRVFIDTFEAIHQMPEYQAQLKMTGLKLKVNEHPSALWIRKNKNLLKVLEFLKDANRVHKLQK